MLTPEEVAKYRQSYGIGVEKKPTETGFFKDFSPISMVKDAVTDVKETASNIKGTLDKTRTAQTNVFNEGVKGTQSKAETVFQFLGETARGTARIAGEAVKGAVKVVTPESVEKGVSAGISKVAEVAAPVVQKATAKIDEFSEKNPRAARNLSAVAGFGELAAEMTGFSQGKRAVDTALDATTTLLKRSKQALGDIKAPGMEGIKEATAKAVNPASLMQRVARISEGKQTKFESVAGESVGQYLVKRKIFGDVDQITTQLYNRFRKSMGEADAKLAELPGNHRSVAVGTALKEMVGREQQLTRPGVVSRGRDRVNELFKKHQGQGLTMPEINEAKRLYERTVKLDFLKEKVPGKIQMANDLDNAIRHWQFAKARELGMKNLDELNRETRLARQLADDLGAEFSGKAGNNAISLTDWFVLAEMTGEPLSTIGLAITKKMIGSQKFMSGAARYLTGKGDAAVPMPKADIGSPVKGYADWVRSLEQRTPKTSVRQTPEQYVAQQKFNKSLEPSGTKLLSEKTESTRVPDSDVIKALPAGSKDDFIGKGPAIRNEALGAAAGFEQDENGNLSFNPLNAALAIGGVKVATTAQAARRVAERVSKGTLDEMARFTEVVKGGHVKTVKGTLKFADTETKKAFENGLRILELDKSMMNRLANESLGKIASFYDSVLKVAKR